MTRALAHRLGSGALPRAVHPGAWWLWALGMTAAAGRTTNPVILGLLLGAVCAVVAMRRPDAPWAASFSMFLALGLFVLVIRLVFTALFGAALPGTVVLPLPEINLPDWLAGVRLGGNVTAPMLLQALYEGLRVAVMLCCLGSANALADPTRLLKALPGALYELGVAVVVAVSFAPLAAAHLARVRTGRRLRGREGGGPLAWRQTVMPVFEQALEHALDLAAAMDSRGYGRRGAVLPGRRRATAALVLGGLLSACVGCYGLLAQSGPALLGWPALLLGSGAALLGSTVAGRSVRRSVYRPDPWALPEWLVVASGVAAAGLLAYTAVVDPSSLTTSVLPPAWPALPWQGVAAALVATVPAWVTPVPPLANRWLATGTSRPVGAGVR